MSETLPSPSQTQPSLVSVRSVIRNDNNDILAVRRSGNGQELGDLWELPGGKPEGRESYLQTARHECEQEVGISIITTGQAVWLGQRLIPDGKHRGRLQQVMAVPARCSLERGRLHPRGEADMAGWFSEAELQAMALTPTSRFVIDQLDLLDSQ